MPDSRGAAEVSLEANHTARRSVFGLKLKLSSFGISWRLGWTGIAVGEARESLVIGQVWRAVSHAAITRFPTCSTDVGN
jgi:hypothetical protein